MTIRESPVVAVAELVIRLTPGPVAERAIRFLGHLDKPVLLLVILIILAAPSSRGPGDWPGGRGGCPPSCTPCIAGVGVVAVSVQQGLVRAELPAAGRRLRHLADLPVAADRAAAPGRARRRGGCRTSEPVGPAEDHPPTRRGFLIRVGLIAVAASVVAGVGRVVGAGRRHVEETRRLLRLSGVTEPTVPTKARIGLRGVSAVADAERRLLPDPHRDRGPDDRAAGLAAAHPRHGRPRAGADLRRAARPAAHRGVDHPELRVQPGRRRPDRQRLVERRTHRGPAGPPGRPRRRERRAPDVRRTAGPAAPPCRSCGTTAMRCWPWP